MGKHKLADLNRMYESGERCDEELFAEMRSNLLLVSGNHYSRKTASFFNRVRSSQKVSETQKLRLTKNHIHKICRYYTNSIDQRVPGVIIVPQNETEMQDRKAAELNQAVWTDAKARYKLKEFFRELKHNFVEIGEMCAFMYWDPDAGEHIGYAPQEAPDGSPVMDESGQMAANKDAPIFSGGFEFKPVPGFNLIRPPSAKCLKKAPYLIIREMVELAELQKAYAGQTDKLKMLGDGDADEFIVFDTNKSSYESDKDHVLVRYQFFRPGKQYPNGYFYMSTERGILEEGELPFGIFPIIWEGFDVFATNPRGYSIVKVARPYQAEINRAASQAATHQITVGDDKIIYQAGTKLAPGALLPGVRGLTFQGLAPQILPGRDGGQFLPYIESQIREMYSACMIEEVNLEKVDGQIDPYALLFRSASQQQRFSQYTEKVESFMKEFVLTFLDLARNYYPDDMAIMAIGKSEAINIAEFKATGPLCYKIKAEESSETIDSKMGKQMALNHVLQYVGAQLDPKQVGLIVKDMPFLDGNNALKRLAVDYDNAENDMLAMERGETPFLSPYADNKVYVDAATNRMKQADFRMLNPQIQQLYIRYVQQHEAEMKRKSEAQQAAQDGMIPTGGALITCSMQVPDPKNPESTKQVRLPYEALVYLMKKLDAQGKDLETLQQMNQGAMAEMMTQMQQNPQPQPQNQQFSQQSATQQIPEMTTMIPQVP
jgi:hypothetical protein